MSWVTEGLREYSHRQGSTMQHGSLQCSLRSGHPPVLCLLGGGRQCGHEGSGEVIMSGCPIEVDIGRSTCLMFFSHVILTTSQHGWPSVQSGRPAHGANNGEAAKQSDVIAELAWFAFYRTLSYTYMQLQCRLDCSRVHSLHNLDLHITRMY